MERDSRITCVIGDDHAVLRRGLAEYIRSEEDIAVIGEAADGREAIALVERRHPDALVIDLNMDGIDGIEVCRRVNALGLGTRVILYTGSEDVEIVDEALEAGATGFVVKSGPPADIVRALRLTNAGQVYVDASLAGALIRRRAAPERSLLSRREHEVVGLLAEGRTTQQAATDLFLSPATVRSYTESAMQKVEARNRTHLVAKSLRMGLLS